MPVMRRSGWLAAVAVVVACLAVRLSAHPAPFSYLDLEVPSAQDASALDAAVVLHVFDLGHDLSVDPAERFLDPSFATSRAEALVALIAGRLHIQADGHVLTPTLLAVETVGYRQSVRVRLRYPMPQETPGVPVLPGSIVIEGEMFPYDVEHQTFVNVYEGETLTQAMLDGGRTRFEYFTGTTQGWRAIVATFLPSGIHHIVIGPDHILFLVGLLLLGGTPRRLAFIVTGFTVAHSVTLSLAALNLLTPPAALVEPAIALSIVYVGVDNLTRRDGRDARVWIACAFGLIHGFGFAGVLREMDLPARALGWSLFSFNLGVEIGQVLILLVLVAVLSAIRAISEVAGRRLVVAGSWVVIGAGAYWFVQRLLVLRAL